MGRKRSPGLRNRNGIWHIDKQILGQSICQSTGTSKLEEAELILARKIEQIRQATVFGVRPKRIFRDAATKYLEENLHLATIGEAARVLKQLDPFIGELPIERVHLGTLAKFIAARKKQGVCSKTINLALSVVRRILNLAARLWRHENGLTWLETPPLIQMLPEMDARKPYPLSWDEQRRLLKALPDHLARMTLFKINVGCREQEVCQLRWDWEIEVPELGTSVFLIPAARVKNREDRLVILNRVAKSIIEEVRGQHPDYVFAYRDKPVGNIRNNAWKRASLEAVLEAVKADSKCVGIEESVVREGENYNIVAEIRCTLKGSGRVLSSRFDTDDYDKERLNNGKGPLMRWERKSAQLRQLIRLKAIQLFIDTHWPVLSECSRVRVHDIKHTFGRRLRAAGMSLETRKVLLGHTNDDITSHYSAPELKELMEAANRVCEQKSGTGNSETKNGLELSL